MKYMGSKRTMLRNGLGEVIAKRVSEAPGFADLFTGSGAVACHVAENFDTPVKASDLQHFAVALANSVISRTSRFESSEWIANWVKRSLNAASSSTVWQAATKLQHTLTEPSVVENAEIARSISSQSDNDLTQAYGGWYFSPLQAEIISSLRQCLPQESAQRSVALAALISAASSCAASPGHTAQPFKSTTGAGKFLIEAWRKDVVDIVSRQCAAVSARTAHCIGSAKVQSADEMARELTQGWVAFVDPPYSSVHYSRFYHVLESIARGYVGEVSGAGRYPPISDRPSSDFSIPTKAEMAFISLFNELATVGAEVVLTFPNEGASNGISGDRLRELASEKFSIVQEKVSSRMSTMGGNTQHRAARHDTVELILCLTPN